MDPSHVASSEAQGELDAPHQTEPKDIVDDEPAKETGISTSEESKDTSPSNQENRLPIREPEETAVAETKDVEQDLEKQAEKETELPEATKELQDLSMSTATLRPPAKAPYTKPSTPPPPSSGTDTTYVDPTPKTPQLSRPVSRTSSGYGEYNEKSAPLESEPTSEAEFEERRQSDAEEVAGKDSQSEIQSIMEQFTDEAEAPGQEEIMSPRLELAGPLLGVGQFPPRRSSLEPLRPLDMSINTEEQPGSPPPVPPKSPPSKGPGIGVQMTPTSPSSLHAPPPPEPEPDLPFDFHRFLEQLRHKSADPVAKFLRSFLTEFGKKQWMVHEQVKIISDFLAFITNKMAQCDVWRDVSDTEFDNAKEGMEKLVMNRLYSQTFSPAIPPPPPMPRSRSKRKDQEKFVGPGRRGQHQEDVERDEILAQKIRIYSWIKEEHLDIPSVGPSGKRFLNLAQQELLKIKGYRAPRDKVICILNCCKVIFGLLKSGKAKDTSADSFVPLLIYVVLQANPEHLVSNVQYILRFRNQEKLGGESGYYLSSLSGAIQFIETLDRTTLTVSDEEFERNVEIAVQAIAEKNREAEANAISPTTAQGPFSDKATSSGPEGTPRASVDAQRRAIKGHQTTLSSDSSVASDDIPAVAGIFKTIQRPLSTLGRIFSDETTTTAQPSSSHTTSTPRGLSPAIFQPPRESLEGDDNTEGVSASATRKYGAEEAAARQASAEAAEAQRIQRREHRNVVETLYGMFPNLDREIIDDVVREKEGRVGLAVDACLALTSGA